MPLSDPSSEYNPQTARQLRENQFCAGINSEFLVERLRKAAQAGLADRQRRGRKPAGRVQRQAAAGIALQEECGCLADALIQRSGMAANRLRALNTDIRALRQALTERQISYG